VNRCYKNVSHCRIFPHQKLEPFFDLGEQPPANALRNSLEEELPLAPLALAWSKQGKLVQLTADVDPAFLFKHYVWTTGVSGTARKYSLEFFQRVQEHINLQQGSSVIEIASNDGTFLRPFQEQGMNVLGIDPARNIAEIATAEGIPTQPDFFCLELATSLLATRGPADVLIARNVLPHVPDVNDVVQGIATLLSDDGLVVIEFHHAGSIVDELHYDSIYHEHYFYYSLESICSIFDKHSLFPVHGFRSPISGGSFVVLFQKTPRAFSSELKELQAVDLSLALGDIRTWKKFAEKSIQHADQFKSLIEEEYARGGTVIGYGASARSSTLLNFCKITNEHLLCIADKSDIKQNLFTAGSDIQIVSPEDALNHSPDCIVLLAWNFENEILNELQERGFTGKVIVPLPGEPRVVNLSN
jgi:SAM-dependent methyltransferase